MTLKEFKAFSEKELNNSQRYLPNHQKILKQMATWLIEYKEKEEEGFVNCFACREKIEFKVFCGCEKKENIT